MSKGKAPIHYVCTREEALHLVRGRERFWVSNCGCREERKGRCRHGRIDVCLQFSADTAASGTGRREITKLEMHALFKFAADSFLVPRPFRSDKDPAVTEGICFCCDDCCYYFLNPGGEPSDKGEYIEKTDMKACTHCGACVDVCRFGARTMEMNGKELAIDKYRCYGCGVCRASCSEECITMVKRAAKGR